MQLSVTRAGTPARLRLEHTLSKGVGEVAAAVQRSVTRNFQIHHRVTELIKKS